MATKLDQSLEDILTTNRKSSGRGRGRRVTRGTKARTAAPVGGIKKSTKSTAKAIVPTGPAVKGESKVIVSNLVRRLKVRFDCFELTPSSLTMSAKARSRYVNDKIFLAFWIFVIIRVSRISNAFYLYELFEYDGHLRPGVYAMQTTLPQSSCLPPSKLEAERSESSRKSMALTRSFACSLSCNDAPSSSSGRRQFRTRILWNITIPTSVNLTGQL